MAISDPMIATGRMIFSFFPLLEEAASAVSEPSEVFEGDGAVEVEDAGVARLEIR